MADQDIASIIMRALQGAYPGMNTPLAQPQAAAPAQSNDIMAVIQELYKKYGLQAGGRGSGFADMAYWGEHPSEVTNGRLEADLAGTGTDNPEGTPGFGSWSNSGRKDFSQSPPWTPPPNMTPLPSPGGGGYSPNDPPPYQPPTPIADPNAGDSPVADGTSPYSNPVEKTYARTRPEDGSGGNLDVNSIVERALRRVMM